MHIYVKEEENPVTIDSPKEKILCQKTPSNFYVTLEWNHNKEKGKGMRDGSGIEKVDEDIRPKLEQGKAKGYDQDMHVGIEGLNLKGGSTILKSELVS